MKQQKIEEKRNMNANNFKYWLEEQNKNGWYVVQIHKWQTYINDDRLDFVLLLEKEVVL